MEFRSKHSLLRPQRLVLRRPGRYQIEAAISLLLYHVLCHHELNPKVHRNLLLRDPIYAHTRQYEVQVSSHDSLPLLWMVAVHLEMAAATTRPRDFREP